MQKFCPDKFSGLLESPGTYRKSSDDFGVTFAVRSDRVEHVQPLMQKAGKLFVVYLVQVSSPEQAAHLLAQDTDPQGARPLLAALTTADDGAIPPIVPVADLADWLCMTERNVQVLEGKGIVFKDGRGQYKLKESVQGYIREIHRTGDGKNSDYNRERTEKMRLDRLQREVEYLEKIGSLVNADHARKMIEKVFALVRQRMLMMPKFLAPRLESLPAQEQEVILEDYARESLAQLAAPDISGIAAGSGMQGDGPAPQVDRKPVGGRKKKARKQDKRRAR